MSLSNVFRKLQALKGVSGKKKEDMFSLFVKEDPLFVKVVQYALDPKKVYSIRKFEWKGPHANGNTEKAFEYLDELASKRGASDSEISKLNMLCSVDRQTFEVFHYILLKDLKCGVGLTIASKYNIGLEKFSVCLCDKDIDKFLKAIGHDIFRIAISTKLDGVRVFATVMGNGQVTYQSRNGLYFKNFKKFDEELINWADYLITAGICSKYPVEFDGEACAKSNEFDDVMKQLGRMVEVDTSGIDFKVFDCPSIPGRLGFRYSELVNIPRIENNVFLLAHRRFRKPAEGGLKEALLELAGKEFETGGEGLVVKDWNSVYEYKRIKFWCKLVDTITEDLYVTGWYHGEPGTKYENELGGLYVDYKGKKVGIGSGFSDEERKMFVREQPKMIEVSYRMVTKDGSLRFPRFKRVRNDKA